MVPLIRFFGRLAKPVLSRTLYRPGNTATILFGPARGLKYKIFPTYGLSMIYGGWEPELHQVMKSYVKPGDVAYDLGANFGIFTMFLSRLVGPTGRVYAFEPLPHILTELKANIERNGQSNVEFVNAAVAETVGTARFRVGHHHGSGHLQATDHLYPESGSEVSVAVTTIDDIVRSGARPPTFMKIDIEGAEGSALAGARETLAAHRPVLAVEVHSEEQGVAVGAALAAANYVAWRIDQNLAPAGALTGDGAGMRLWGFVLARPAERGTASP